MDAKAYQYATVIRAQESRKEVIQEQNYSQNMTHIYNLYLGLGIEFYSFEPA